MSSKTIIPKVVLKRQGNFNAVMVELRALEHAHPNLTAGDMAEALNNPTFNLDCHRAEREKQAGE